MEEVICQINQTNSDLFAGLIRQIVAYLPDFILQIVTYLLNNQSLGKRGGSHA